MALPKVPFPEMRVLELPPGYEGSIARRAYPAGRSTPFLTRPDASA